MFISLRDYTCNPDLLSIQGWIIGYDGGPRFSLTLSLLFYDSFHICLVICTTKYDITDIFSERQVSLNRKYIFSFQLSCHLSTQTVLV